MSDDALYAKMMAATAKANAAVAARLPLSDQADFDAAAKGRIADAPSGVMNAAGRPAWDLGQYAFLESDAPATVNPSLWRMGQLNTIGGLFEVADGVWQARACDYANMTVIRGETGWILIDPLMTVETSAAALAMVNEMLGARPVSAILVTHTHPDHFGGIRGVADADNPPPIYAPEGFTEFAASEGILGGNLMARRATYQFGLTLPQGPEGTIDGGIGKSPAKGRRTFLPPSETISRTGEERVIDGVRFVFQMASGTEAPAEFTFLLPDHRVLCMAEVCTQTQHNLVPPRGAEVRDARLWAKVIDEAITLFGDRADTLINCHNWPVFGAEAMRRFLAEQRDAYKYLHDQTLRLANLGYTPNEIAAMIEEPDWWRETFHARGYYGSLTFNARAVYQRYFGTYDGNPVNLNPLPPAVLGRHMVDAVGGAEAVMATARGAMGRDELQWAATLLSHLVFAGEGGPETHTKARALLAETFRHLGYREESGIMRNVYLMGAKDLVEGVQPLPMAGGRNEDLAASLTLEDWLDAYALRLNPERARGVEMAVALTVDDVTATVRVARQVENTAPGAGHDAEAHLTISLITLEAVTSGAMSLEEALESDAKVAGDQDALVRWLSLHDRFEMWFELAAP